MPVSVVIADDHPLFLSGVQHGLTSAGFVVLAAVHDGDAAVHAAERWRPDAVLLDVRMPQRSGVDACAAILAAGHARVGVLLSTWADVMTTRRARDAGARALLSKESTIDEIVACINSLLADKRAEWFPHHHAPALTDRETEVLQGLAQGLSRKQIASRLGLSPETIKDYITSLFLKLDAQDKVSVVTNAVSRGVLALPPDGGGHQG